MIIIPDQATKKWSQANNSDLFGVLSETKGISFEMEGYMALAHSSRAAMDDTVDGDFDRPAVILFNGDNSRYFIETWDEPFDIARTILQNDAAQVTGSDHPNGSPTSDGVWFDSKMAISEDGRVNYYDASTNAWVQSDITLTTGTSGAQHPLANFLSKSALAVADINTVKLYSVLGPTSTLLTTLTIPTDYQITSLKYFNQNLYVGTRHKWGGEAAMYVWNGDGTAAQSVYTGLDSNIIHDLCVWRDSIVALVSNGSLQQFNGGGWTFLDAFPIYYTENVLTDESNINLYHNCLKPKGNVIYISFSDNDNNARRILSQPDGIWCYDPKVGLHCKYPFSNSLTYKLSDPAINTTSDQITVAKVIPTGTEVWYSAGTANAALVDDTKYFAIYVDSTHIRLATTKANAVAGTYINFTADDGVAEKWTFFPNIDYGSSMTSGRGAAIQTIDFTQQNPEYGVDIIWGASVNTRTNGLIPVLGSVSNGVEARGYAVTPRIFSSQVTDTFNLITLKFKPFMSELDKIIIKYRTKDDGLTSINISDTTWRITWTSSSTFTVSGSRWAQALAGDEIHVLRGAAGGLLAHITTISDPVGGVYTVTIDETFEQYLSGDISTAVFRNWKKWVTVTRDGEYNDQGYFSKELGETGKFIQFKIEMRGIGTTIEEFMLDNVYKLIARKSEDSVDVV